MMPTVESRRTLQLAKELVERAREDLPPGLIRSILKQAGLERKG